MAVVPSPHSVHPFGVSAPIVPSDSTTVSIKSEKEKPQQSFLRQSAELIGCAGGIYVCFIVYGLIQEKLYATKWGPEKEKFDHSLFLVFVQCIGNALFALILGFFMKSAPNKVPALEYCKISFSYIGAMFASNYALSFMSYPAQALAKSCKLIPVMLARIVLMGKRYSLREYAQVVLITGGICVFMLFEGTKKSVEKETSWIGLGLCLLSLILDGYTGPSQERLNHEYKPTFSQLMFYLNLYAIMMVAAALLVTGQMWTGLGFFMRHTEVITQAAAFALLSAMGQAMILFTLLRFNSLVVVTVTTTRKFFTILASVALYGHALGLAQWSGVLLVFAGLSIDIYAKYADRNKKKGEKKHP